jgi:hypothetical protein
VEEILGADGPQLHDMDEGGSGNKAVPAGCPLILIMQMAVVMANWHNSTFLFLVSDCEL